MSVCNIASTFTGDAVMAYKESSAFSGYKAHDGDETSVTS